MYAYLCLANTSTPTMMLGTSTSDSTNNVVIGGTVGVITIVLVAIITIVCVIVAYKRKRKLSVSYPVTHPTSGISLINIRMYVRYTLLLKLITTVKIIAVLYILLLVTVADVL